MFNLLRKIRAMFTPVSPEEMFERGRRYALDEICKCPADTPAVLDRLEVLANSSDIYSEAVHLAAFDQGILDVVEYFRSPQR